MKNFLDSLSSFSQTMGRKLGVPLALGALALPGCMKMVEVEETRSHLKGRITDCLEERFPAYYSQVCDPGKAEALLQGVFATCNIGKPEDKVCEKGTIFGYCREEVITTAEESARTLINKKCHDLLDQKGDDCVVL